jgi:hypothetical protein
MSRQIQSLSLLATSVLLILPISLAAQATTTPASQPTASTTEPTGATDQDIQMLRENIRAKRKQIVAANISLTTDEAKRFWPLFDQYTAEVRKINDKRWTMMKEYAANYSHLTNEQAKDHMHKSAAVDGELIALRNKYIPEFEKRVAPKKVVQFYQIDRRLDLLMNLELMSLIPVVDPGT